jgi:hypothetical protein
MNTILSNVEYIAIKMQSTPGKPGRFYRKALSQYKGKDCNGSRHSRYFWKNDRYGCVRKLWIDFSEKEEKPRMRVYGGGYFKKKVPIKCQWFLTARGWEVANRARAKLKLEPLCYREKK